MARTASPYPTDAELEILRILWESGPSTIGEICSAIRERREVATTTVATVLKVMRGKKQVKRKKSTQGFVWSAQTEHSKTATGMVRSLTDRLFDGSAHRLVSHILESGELTDEERNEMRSLLESDGSKQA
jgi:predicted transcriptional regulator